MANDALHARADAASAAAVVAALTALHGGGSDVAAADAFLRRTQASAPSALPVAAALLAPAKPPLLGAHALSDDPMVRAAALHFAANALRTHAHAAPGPAADLACAALAARAHLDPPVLAAVCAAAAHRVVREPELLPGAFHRLRAACGDGDEGDARRCVADEAVGAHVARLVSGNALPGASAVCARRMCADVAGEVLAAAVGVLLRACDSGGDAVARVQRDAVACIRAWAVFAGDVRAQVIEPLLGCLCAKYVLCAPDLAVAVGEALEIMTGASHPTLHAGVLCHVLAAVRRVCVEARGREFVKHAVAEVCATFAESCGDFVLECVESDAYARTALVEALDLLSECVQCQEPATFEAALMAWDTWIASASVLDSVHTQQIVIASLPLVVKAVMAHLGRVCARRNDGGTFGGGVRSERSSPKSPVQCARPIPGNDDDETEAAYVRLQSIARDTLHQAAQLMTLTDYIRVILPLLESEAGLFGLEAAGDVSYSEQDLLSIAAVLPRVTSLVVRRGQKVPIPVRVAALRALAAYGQVLTSRHVNDELLSALLTAACSSVRELGRDPAMLLKEVAESCAARLVPFLHVLIETAKDSITCTVHEQEGGQAMNEIAGGSSWVGPRIQGGLEATLQALSLVAAELPERPMRKDALGRIIGPRIARLQHVGSGALDIFSGKKSMCIARDLRLVSVSVRALNDSCVAASLLESLSVPLRRFSDAFAAESAVAPAICNLLEVCVGPTLCDPDEKHVNGHTQGVPEFSEEGSRADWSSRVISCIGLAAESFAASGPRGEACWLTTIAELCIHLSTSPLPATVACLSNTLHVVLRSLHTFAPVSDGGLQARPDLLCAFMKLCIDYLGVSGCKDSRGQCCAGVPGLPAMTSSAGGCGHVAFLCLYVDDANVLLGALQWWNCILSTPAYREVAERATTQAGGVQSLCDGVLQSSLRGASSRRCVALAADVILLLRRSFSHCELVLSHVDPGALVSGNVGPRCVELYSSFTSGNSRRFRSAVARLRTARLEESSICVVHGTV